MGKKRTIHLSKNLNASRLSRRIALLAGAAAALPIAAHADAIIYSGPQNITGDANGSNGDQTYTVNVDGNAASGFTFTATDPGPYKEVYVTPQGTNAYLAPSSAPNTDPTPMAQGQEVSSSSTFATGQGTLSKTGFERNDYNWPANGAPAFLGVTFTDSSPAVGTSATGTYYGWIEVGATTDDAVYNILGWAYYNTGGPILAGQTGPGTFVPEPSSLALLALGAAGLLALRARRKSARA